MGLFLLRGVCWWQWLNFKCGWALGREVGGWKVKLSFTPKLPSTCVDKRKWRLIAGKLSHFHRIALLPEPPGSCGANSAGWWNIPVPFSQEVTATGKWGLPHCSPLRKHTECVSELSLRRREAWTVQPFKELTSPLWCWERLKAKGDGGGRGWDS